MNLNEFFNDLVGIKKLCVDVVFAAYSKSNQQVTQLDHFRFQCNKYEYICTILLIIHIVPLKSEVVRFLKKKIFFKKQLFIK